ncbi:hypothetical protein MATL_G00222350 [Megalops atlanticus]|uniref:Uncharacterized protein n=1 Tax=Megalops atlanticus TaxID=7932 RepID=A0A9D3SWY1_MEGAT|nr:hypothetical protein MATL_G00222350 [Megalops atlanticus]
MKSITVVMCLIGLCASLPVLDEHERAERSASNEGYGRFYPPYPPFFPFQYDNTFQTLLPYLLLTAKQEPASSMQRVTMVMCLIGLCASLPVLNEHHRIERSSSNEGYGGFVQYPSQPSYPFLPFIPPTQPNNALQTLLPFLLVRLALLTTPAPAAAPLAAPMTAQMMAPMNALMNAPVNAPMNAPIPAQK